MLGAGLLVLLPLTTACIEEGPTSHPADEDDVRTMTEGWTGVALPEDISLVTATYVSDFLDPSLSATFDARTADVDRFIGGLGPRRVRYYAPDCSSPPAPVVFTELPSAGPASEPASPQGLGDEAGGAPMPDILARRVGPGDLERCGKVTVVDARPRGTYVSVTAQLRPGDRSRVSLSVVTT